MLIFAAFFTFYLLNLALNLKSAEAYTEVIGIKKILSSPASSIFLIDLTSQSSFTKGRLSNPERIFIDIKHSKLSKSFKNELIQQNDPFLKGIRVGQFNPETVRVVFDLKENVNPNTFIETRYEPISILIELTTEQSKTIEDTFIQNEKESFLKKKIVLDPGHGGHDPGAVGYNGLFEKDVVLDIALKVKEIMNKNYPNFQVILTRETDIFIPLQKRTEIANKANADLFISIHANASYNRLAQGIETYILNWTDDEEAMKVAARENAISLKEMKKLKDELSIILASLESESKRDESIKAAGFIHNYLINVKPFENLVDFDRGIKQALFYVLVGAKMPAALLEVGFISNSIEEKLLSNETYRSNIARSIANGIVNYFSDTPNKRLLTQDKRIEIKKDNMIPIKYSKLKR
ncbi:MAG: N-acetylmuramoyl-L-alanine amidase [Thermodesulfovibrionales bacterium]|nr:N-acetylmuramoyl-L-alanine amidase [Thermodesulfovibrionales bacterium]